ncbi:hypothetical protein D9Q98_005940 [Chlorella vulgaris]|uniref:RAP domain-containing protein n=1 Tax=Chlorella vulgaris TaxID=3077 RepID=A0A9D4TWN3_CHLVU|nr:hypothetical protein D9Q98_005940 [Chlorella vulgaris]
MTALTASGVPQRISTLRSNNRAAPFLRKQPAACRQQGAAPAPASGARRPTRRLVCAAFTEQGRDGKTDARVADASEANGSSAHGGGSSGEPLVQRIAACTTSTQLHHLLLRHVAEVGGLEVAAALDTAVKHKLLGTASSAEARTASGPVAGAGSSSGGMTDEASGSSSASAALSALLVHLTAAHAAAMEASTLSSSACSLGALKLQPARPVMRTLHSLAHQRLLRYSPSQLCTLMWAGSSLDPAFRSPLFGALAGLLESGMSLTLFTPHDLAVLAWLCGREGSVSAKGVLEKVIDEVRERLTAHRLALEHLEEQRASAEAAAAGMQAPGINFVHDTPVADAVQALGVRMRVNAWKRLISAIKNELAAISAGKVLVDVELLMCSRQELNPVVLAITDDGRLINKPLDAFANYKWSHKVGFRLMPRMQGLLHAADRPEHGSRTTRVASSSVREEEEEEDWQLGGGASSASKKKEDDHSSFPAAQLSQADASAVLKECEAACMFWEALTPRGRQVAIETGASTFSVIVTMTSGERQMLTWRRVGTELLPVEASGLPPLNASHAGLPAWVPQPDTQQQQQQEEVPPPPPPQQPSAPVPPSPPFGPRQAALLLTGLAQLQLRVGGVVEPLLQQCLPALMRAPADDVARIIVALGELGMEPAAELLAVLIQRFSATRDSLSPRQVVAVLWAAYKVGRWLPRVISIGVRHLTANLANYQTVDLVGMMWACGQLKGMIPDSTLTAALRRLPPRELKQCSTASLCNLVWALGKMVSVRAGSEPRSGAPGRRAATTGENRWLQSPAGVEARAVTHAAATELAARQLTAHDVSAVAMALATHSSLTGLLPARAVAIVRGACVAALAADAFTSSELASLAVAAARMRWDDSPLLDGLTRALLPRVSALAQPGDVVRALAGLAPGSAGTLFVSLAHAYIGKMKHQLMHDGHLLPADLDSRSASLAAFSAVGQAQGLPKDVLTDLVKTVSPIEMKKLSARGQVAVLSLAAQAELDRTTPQVQACCAALLRSVDSMSADVLRQTWHALRRLRRYDPELIAAMDAYMAQLPPADPPQLL